MFPGIYPNTTNTTTYRTWVPQSILFSILLAGNIVHVWTMIWVSNWYYVGNIVTVWTMILRMKGS